MGIFGSENKAMQPGENKSQGDETENHPVTDPVEVSDNDGRISETGDDGEVIPAKTNTNWYLYEDREPNSDPMAVGVIGYFRLIDGELNYSALLRNADGEYSKYGERDRSVEQAVDITSWPERQRERLSVIKYELELKQ